MTFLRCHMHLPVLELLPDGRPWYADGLRFSCTQCGNCCTGPPGYVWISEVEVARLAEFLKLTEAQVIRRYCHTINGRLSLTEQRNHRGEYDCVFLKEEPSPGGKKSRTPGRRTCTIYPVRPLQCRTWPFWDGLLQDRDAWEASKRKCPGMDQGKLHVRAEIERRVGAEDWLERKE